MVKENSLLQKCRVHCCLELWVPLGGSTLDIKQVEKGVHSSQHQGIIATARDIVMNEWHVSADNKAMYEGLITSSVLLGAMIGSFAGGLLGKKLGRKMSNAIGCGVCLFGVLGSSTFRLSPSYIAAFSPHIWIFLTFRLFLGAGIGITAVICPMCTFWVEVITNSQTYQKWRLNRKEDLLVSCSSLQSLLAFSCLFSSVGVSQHSVVVQRTDFVCTHSADVFTPFYQWRVMLGVGFIFPVALLGLTLLKMIEPRVSSTLTTVTNELQSNTREMDFGPKASISDVCKQGKLRMLLLTNTILAAILQLTGKIISCVYWLWAGINAVMFYGTKILNDSGLGNPNAVNIVWYPKFQPFLKPKGNWRLELRHYHHRHLFGW